MDESKQFKLQVRGGEATFIINDVNPFRVQAILNRVSGLVDLNTIGNLMALAAQKEDERDFSVVAPDVLELLRKTDETTLEKLVDLLLCKGGCRYTITKWQDFEMQDVTTLFTGEWTNLYVLLYHALEVNFRPLARKLKGKKSDPLSAVPTQTP